MKTALEHIKEITNDFRAYTAMVTITDIHKIQNDALLHAACLAERAGEHLRQDDLGTGEPIERTPEMAEGAFNAAEAIRHAADGIVQSGEIEALAATA